MTPADDPAVLVIRRKTLAARLADLHEAEDAAYRELQLVELRLRRLGPKPSTPSKEVVSQCPGT